jgi:hypothetical protein
MNRELGGARTFGLEHFDARGDGRGQNGDFGGKVAELEKARYGVLNDG